MVRLVDMVSRFGNGNIAGFGNGGKTITISMFGSNMDLVGNGMTLSSSYPFLLLLLSIFH